MKIWNFHYFYLISDKNKILMLKTLKTIFSIVTIVVLSTLIGFAQNSNQVNLNLTDEFKAHLREPTVYRCDTNVVYFLEDNKKYYLTAFSIATKRVGNSFNLKTVLKKAGTSLSDVISCYVYKGNLVFLTQDFSKNDNLLKISYSIISSEGSVKSASKLLLKVNSKKESKVNVEVDLNSTNFTIRTKSILDNYIEEELTIANYSYSFVQESILKLNTKDILQNKRGSMYPLYGYSDSLYMINIFQEEDKTNKINRVSSVFAFSKTGNKVFNQELRFGIGTLYNFKLLRVGNETRLIAYYMDDKSYGIEGSVVYVYSATQNKFILKETNKVPVSVKEAFLSKRDVKNDRGLVRFEFSDTKINSNGEYFNINEQSIKEDKRKENPVTKIKIPISEFYTGSELLLEKYDKTGKLEYITNVRIPEVYTGEVAKKTFNLMTQGNKTAIYFTTKAKNIDLFDRMKIIDYKITKGHSIYIYDITESEKSEWKQIDIPLEKGYYIDNITYLSGSTKAFIVMSKRRPFYRETLIETFHLKYKTKVGIVDIKL